MLSWLQRSRRAQTNTNHTYTPARQRALTRRSYFGAAIAVVAIILALSQFGEAGLATFFKLRSHEKELMADVQQLEAQNTQLQEKMVGLATDPAALEKMARQEHNMQQPHEEVLTVFPEKQNNGTKN